MRRPRIAYWNNEPTPYVVGRFNAIVDRDFCDFEAWFDEPRGAERQWAVDPATWRFPARYLPQRGPGRGLRVPVAEVRAFQPNLVVTTFDRPHTAIGTTVARAWVDRVAFRVLPAYEEWGVRSRPREAAKRLLFSMIDGAKVPGDDGAAYAATYGLPPDRAWRVTQGIDVTHYASALDVSPAATAALRRAHAVHGCVFLYVGRLWEGKGVSYLIDAFRSVRKANPDCSLVLVGHGPQEAELRARAVDVPDVVFAGHVEPVDLPLWYAAADVLILPTLGDPNGLVVEEAMAAGLPVISSANAGDIRRRIADGRNGYVVATADVRELAERMELFAADPARTVRMRDAARDHARRYTFDAYAADFETFARGVLEGLPRTGPGVVAGRALGRIASAVFAGAAAPHVRVAAPAAAPPVQAQISR